MCSIWTIKYVILSLSPYCLLANGLSLSYAYSHQIDNKCLKYVSWPIYHKNLIEFLVSRCLPFFTDHPECHSDLLFSAQLLKSEIKKGFTFINALPHLCNGNCKDRIYPYMTHNLACFAFPMFDCVYIVLVADFWLEPTAHLLTNQFNNIQKRSYMNNEQVG